MKALFLPGALRDLDDIFAYIARDNPIAADRLVKRIEDAAQLLSGFPDAGQALTRRGLHRFAIPGTPYSLIYRPVHRNGELRIVRILHGARRRPTAFQ